MLSILSTANPVPDPTPIPGKVTLSYRAQAEPTARATAKYTIEGAQFVGEESATTAVRAPTIGPLPEWYSETFMLTHPTSVSPTVTLSLSAPGEITKVAAWGLNAGMATVTATAAAKRVLPGRKPGRIAAVVAALALILLLLFLVLRRAR